LPVWEYSFKLPLISTGSATGNLLEIAICTGYGLLVLGLVIGNIRF
jgi:inner membrane protein